MKTIALVALSLFSQVKAEVEIEEDKPLFEQLHLRLEASQLYTDDSQSDIHRSFTQLRGSLATRGLFGLEQVDVEADARARFSLDGDPHAYDVTSALIRYRPVESLSIAVGRQTIGELLTARVDGGRLSLHLLEGDLTISAFGGLMPHPITGALDTDFTTAGAGYSGHSEAVEHSGGLALQMFTSEIDRIYFTEQLFARLGQQWIAYGHVTIDLRDGFDPTNAQLSVRFRPSTLVDFTLSGSHVHAILPRRWIEDWIQDERARLGFTIDRVDPVGTRRTSARLTTNLHPLESLTTYLVLRYDHRHEDASHGYHGQLGLSVDLGPIRGNAYGAYSNHFLTRNASGGLDLSTASFGGLMLYGGAAVLRPLDQPSFIWDFHGTVMYDFGALTGALRGVRALALYQGFLQDDLLLHAFFFRIGWVFRG